MQEVGLRSYVLQSGICLCCACSSPSAAASSSGSCCGSDPDGRLPQLDRTKVAARPGPVSARGVLRVACERRADANPSRTREGFAHARGKRPLVDAPMQRTLLPEFSIPVLWALMLTAFPLTSGKNSY